jgi:excinuclease ABC subunit B
MHGLHSRALREIVKTDASGRASERRRNKQIAFNLANGITPIGVQKKIKDIIDGLYDPEEEKKKGRDSKAKNEFAAMSEKTLKSLEKAMLDAARNLEFEKAAELRDQLTKLKAEMFGVGAVGER